jgi:predicted porin
MTKKVFILVFTISNLLVFSQEKKVLDSINFYGKISAHAAGFDDKVQLQENAPRLGLQLFKNINSDWSVNGTLELGLQFIKGANFNNDANSATEFLANPVTNPDVFFARLASVSFSHKTWGSLSVGKQWGVYYDIGGYTDAFTLFGGSATGIYAGKTDGGWKGTGRADNSIQYRNKFGGFQFGLQTQLFGDTYGFGASAQYQFPFGLSIGTSYNTVETDQALRDYVINVGDDSSNFIAGIKYKKDKIYAAFNFALNDDSFVILDDETALAFPTYGYETLLGYDPTGKWHFEGGFNMMIEDGTEPYLDGEYRLLQYILGVNYFMNPSTKIYLESRFDDSKYIAEEAKFNVIALGFSYDFNLSKNYN